MNLERYLFDLAKTALVINKLPVFLDRLVAELPSPVRVPELNGTFRWDFPEKSARVVAICKLARASSGISAAWELCELGYLPEAASLLRMVSDYSQEILALGEGIKRGAFTSAQQRFIDDFFSPVARTPEEYERQERRSYIGREEHLKAQLRLIGEVGEDVELTKRLRRFLNHGYDGYVHGNYLTAMQMYNGLTRQFEVAGDTDNQSGIETAQRSLAGKLHEVVVAFEFMSILIQVPELSADVREARLTIAPFTT